MRLMVEIFGRVSSWRSNIVVFVGHDHLRKKKTKILEDSLEISTLGNVDYKRTLLCWVPWVPINTSNQTLPQLSSSRSVVSSQCTARRAYDPNIVFSHFLWLQLHPQ
jgi:hypothetical protein